MILEAAIAETLRQLREAAGLTQEDFIGVSGRSYLSELERGLKSPTVQKIDELAGRLEVHPLTFLTLCFTKKDGVPVAELQELVLKQMANLGNKDSTTTPPLPAT